MENGLPAPDPAAPEPLYVQVARLLRDQVISGALGLGALMPGEIALTERWSVSRYTVTKAYELLEAEGLVMARKGVGRFVAAVPPPRVIGLGPGDELRVRMPGDAERRALAIGHGIPVLVITRAGGGTEAHSAAAAVVRCAAAAGGPPMPALA